MAAVRAISGTYTLVWRPTSAHPLYFDVPPVHYVDGTLIAYYDERIRVLLNVRNTREEVEQLQTTIREFLDLAHALVQPAAGLAGWLYARFASQRRRWHAGPNPFARATLGEVMELLGFFQQCRMNSTLVVVGIRHEPRSRQRSTSPRTSYSSRGKYRNGWETMVTPLAGDTTS